MANDLISREAALEAAKTGLRNFAGIHWTPNTRQYVPKVVHGVRDALQNVPAIDAVPVVRCKDCKHLLNGCGCKMFGGGDHYPVVLENDFCSYGERKES